jgi:hypothetical protein
MKLVHKDTGKPVELGARLKNFRGETYYLRSDAAPHKPGSTGKVYVTKTLDEDAFNEECYFPQVFNLEFRQ